MLHRHLWWYYRCRISLKCTVYLWKFAPEDGSAYHARSWPPSYFSLIVHSGHSPGSKEINKGFKRSWTRVVLAHELKVVLTHQVFWFLHLSQNQYVLSLGKGPIKRRTNSWITVSQKQVFLFLEQRWPPWPYQRSYFRVVRQTKANPALRCEIYIREPPDLSN